MRLIECRSCDEPDCTGCNLHRLAFALRRGLFDACKDDHNAVRITSEVAPVVRCRECKYYMKSNEMCELVDTRLKFYSDHKRWAEESFCSWGERKDGDV